jgi:hypothetical protein
MFPKEKNLSDYMREVKNLRISNIEKSVTKLMLNLQHMRVDIINLIKKY